MSYFYVNACLALCLNSVLNVKALVGTTIFQPEEGPSEKVRLQPWSRCLYPASAIPNII